MAEVQKHSADVLGWITMLRNRREIEKWKEERMGISLMCTSLEEKAPASRSAPAVISSVRSGAAVPARQRRRDGIGGAAVWLPLDVVDPLRFLLLP
jgi:hypothetical protein